MLRKIPNIFPMPTVRRTVFETEKSDVIPENKNRPALFQPRSRDLFTKVVVFPSRARGNILGHYYSDFNPFS